MLLLLSLSLLLLGGVVGTETDETMKVMEGDSVTLHTNLTDIRNDDTILWLFGPKESVISQITRKNDLTSYFVTDDVLFRGRLQVDQKSGSLTIRNTRVRHSGQFKLSISREKTTKKTFHVTVFDVVGETDGVKSVSVKEGESVTLNTDVSEVQREDLVVWRFGDKGILLAKIDVETNKISLNDADERFRDRLKLDQQTGSLTITNTRTEHSGLYELQIIGRESSQRFLLSVTAVPDPGLSPRAIAGIVVAALLVAAVLSSVVIYYRRKISKLQMVNEVSVADGDSVTLKTGTVLQKDDKTKWWYLHHNDLIAEINGVTKEPYAGLDKRFRSKLELDDKTGSLTINNTMPIHSGLYILEISSKTRRTIKKRFILTVEMMTVPVKEGKATLEIINMKQTDDLILWTFGPENRLVVKADSATSIGERFKDRLELDHQTGSLIIKDIKDTDYGHFKLQLINSKHTTFKRFNVTVTGPTGEHLNNSMTAENPLLDKV